MCVSVNVSTYNLKSKIYISSCFNLFSEQIIYVLFETELAQVTYKYIKLYVLMQLLSNINNIKIQYQKYHRHFPLKYYPEVSHGHKTCN